MAEREGAATGERVRPPRFGRGVQRPRCEHAREAAEKAEALMADIDQVLTCIAPDA